MNTSDKDLKKLWGLAANRCSFPNCAESLIAPIGDTNSIVVGEMAHVVARSPLGPRGETVGGANTYENLILLCPTHHKLVDKAPKGTYPSSVLLQWKVEHESRMRELTRPNITTPTPLGRIRPLPALWPHFVDRQTQAVQLGYELKHDPVWQRPIVLLVQGDQREEIIMYAKRLATLELRTMASSSNSEFIFRRLPLVVHSSIPMNDRVCTAISSFVGTSPNRAAKGLADLKCPVVLYVEFSQQDWHRQPAILSDLLAVWNRWPDGSGEYPLVVIIAAVCAPINCGFEDSRTLQPRIASRMTSAIKSGVKSWQSMDGCKLVVLSELTPAVHEDVLVLLQSLQSMSHLNFLDEENWKYETANTFKERNSRRMRFLEPELRAALSKLLKQSQHEPI